MSNDTEEAGAGAGSRQAVWIAGGLAVAAIVAAIFWQGRAPEGDAPVETAEDAAQPVPEQVAAPETPAPAPETVTAGEPAEAPAAAAEAEAPPADTAETPPADTAEAPAEDTSAEDAASAAPADAPSFDVVRVEPDGAALVAGRAAPGARVEVQVDGVTVGDATADATGGFVAMLDVGVAFVRWR